LFYPFIFVQNMIVMINELERIIAPLKKN